MKFIGKKAIFTSVTSARCFKNYTKMLFTSANKISAKMLQKCKDIFAKNENEIFAKMQKRKFSSKP